MHSREAETHISWTVYFTMNIHNFYHRRQAASRKGEKRTSSARLSGVRAPSCPAGCPGQVYELWRGQVQVAAAPRPGHVSHLCQEAAPSTMPPLGRAPGMEMNEVESCCHGDPRTAPQILPEGLDVPGQVHHSAHRSLWGSGCEAFRPGPPRT